VAEPREGKFSAADMIDALRRRALRNLRLHPLAAERPAGEFPPGWASWLEAMGQRSGAIRGATEASIVGILLQREPQMPPRHAVELNRWQAFTTLWRQQWQPPAREDRRVRMAALVITLILHVLFSAILLWLAYARFTAEPAATGEEIVQVQYIGEGTPDEAAGGPAADTSELATQPTAPPAAASPAPSPPQAAAAQPGSPALSSPPPPPSPAPQREQPLQVSSKATPDAVFVLPPPTPRRVELPQAQLTVPQLQAPTQDVELIERPPAITPLQPQLPTPAITAPRLATEPRPIDITVPLPKIQAREIPTAVPPTPALQENAPPVQLRERAAPTPAGSNATKPATAAARPAANGSPADATRPSAGPPATRSGGEPAATASGSGPASTAKPGAWPTPERGDDWGASTRNQPGGKAGKPGLLNADGTPRVPAGTAEAGGGFPPGTDRWSREDFDRAGTWLKRPPTDYTPTRFEKLWVPSETLLEEWVRKNIRSVEIPIPGTSKKLHCVVSLLQLGGGCGISDPNINDQEAEARPPPDIPFKPELQEDQDVLRKPATP
jgi:hypothetical protein